MEQRQLIEFLGIIEKLKCNTRHSWTSSGRQESVAEHSWRLAVMALLCADEYPELDNGKIVKMCLIHDFGEAITGDIPSFYKTPNDETRESAAIKQLLSVLPGDIGAEFSELFDEMEKLETPESKLVKSLDKLETLISHNEAPLSTWLPLEYSENFIYGQKNADFSEWTKKLKEEISKDSIEKIEKGI